MSALYKNIVIFIFDLFINVLTESLSNYCID